MNASPQRNTTIAGMPSTPAAPLLNPEINEARPSSIPPAHIQASPNGKYGNAFP
jgi:hypothetical protein